MYTIMPQKSDSSSKSQDEIDNDAKLKETVERIKQKYQKPAITLLEIGWSTTPGVKVIKEKSEHKQGNKKKSSIVSSSSCYSPRNGTNTSKSSFLSTKKTNDNNRPGFRNESKTKSVQDKLKVRFKTPKESHSIKTSTDKDYDRKKTLSFHAEKYKNNFDVPSKKSKERTNIDGNKMQNTKQKSRPIIVQNKAKVSSESTKTTVVNLEHENRKKSTSKSTFLSSASKKPRLSNTTTTTTEKRNDNQTKIKKTTEILDDEIQRVSKECQLMHDECKKANPSIEVLLKSMEVTFPYRASLVANGALVSEVLQCFPALKYFRIIKRDFEKTQSMDFPRFEEKVRERLEKSLLEHRKKYNNGTPTGEKCLDSAIDRMKSEGFNKDLFLDIQSLTFGFSKSGARLNGTLFKCRDKSKGEEAFKGQFPSIDICGELGTKNCRITLYCEHTKITRVPNFYEALICTYAMYWVFSICYEKTVEPLFKEFDSILKIGETYD